MGEKSAAEDSLLVFGVREGNKSAFNALYKKYWKFVYGAAYKRSGDTDQAKDIAQDVFIQLWTRLSSQSQSGEIENLPAYLYIAVRNNVFKWMEKEKKFVPIQDLLLQLESHLHLADAQLLYNELYTAYENLIDQLPKQQQVIFSMRYHQELSSDEIATRLNISPKTVRNQLGRALSKLKATFLWTLLWLTSSFLAVV